MRASRQVLAAACCASFLLTFVGCAVFKAVLPTEGYIVIRAEAASSGDRQTDAAIYQQVLGIVDQVALSRGFYRYSLAGDPVRLKSETYLRRYRKDKGYTAVILVTLRHDCNIPDVTVQGSTGAVAEIGNTAKSIDRELRMQVSAVQFKREAHSDISFN